MKRSAPTRLSQVGQLRRAAKVGDAASASVQALLKPVKTLGFPYRKPTVPKGMVVPPDVSRLGANFETGWARSTPAKAARTVLTNGPMRAMVQVLASPEVVGLDRLADITRADEPPALIFAPNHHSHVDTPLMHIAVPEPWRALLAIQNRRRRNRATRYPTPQRPSRRFNRRRKRQFIGKQSRRKKKGR